MSEKFSVSDYKLFQLGASSTNSFRSSLSAYKTELDEKIELLKDETVFKGPIADYIIELINRVAVNVDALQSSYDKIAIKLTDIYEHYEEGDNKAAKNLIDGIVTNPSMGINSLSSSSVSSYGASSSSSSYGASSNSTANKAVNWATEIASDNSYGYINGGTGNGGYDCTQFIHAAYSAAGVDLPDKFNVNQTNIVDYYTSHGFTWHPGKINPDELQAGDVLVNEEHHAEMYIGNGKKVGAHNDYDGSIGDSQGNEISVNNYSEYSKGGWDGYLRYEG